MSFEKEFLKNNGCSSFDEYSVRRFEEMIPEARKDSWAGCGLVYELGEARFCSWVENYAECYSAPVQKKIFEIASRHGYVSEEVRDEQNEGLCSHFMEPDYCPMGCGEY